MENIPLLSDLVQKRIIKMGLSEDAEAFGLGQIEEHVLSTAFMFFARKHPKMLKNIIDSELDFLLAPVEENN